MAGRDRLVRVRDVGRHCHDLAFLNLGVIEIDGVGAP